MPNDPAPGDLLVRNSINLRFEVVDFQGQLIDGPFQTLARAIMRADLWNPEKHVTPDSLPTPGQILAALSNGDVGGEAYDRAWPERAKQSMW